MVIRHKMDIYACLVNSIFGPNAVTGDWRGDSLIENKFIPELLGNGNTVLGCRWPSRK